MYLKELQRNWDIFGQEDALWAVCTAPEKKNNKWDTQEFFQTGVKRINRLRQWMDDNSLPKQRKAALDFGCGVGRLTQALCDHFDTCVGVDIAPSMIEKAKGFNRHGWKCMYRLNEQADLRAFQSSSFDLINTEHVLQHIRPEVALRYIAEFVRILKPGGLAYFHCPSQASTFAYPEDGIQCTLDAPPTPILMETGAVAEFPVTVTNTGCHPIGTGKTVNAPAKIIHHWVELNKKIQHRNHGYLNLPAGVIQSRGTMTFDYKAASPQGPGEYALVLTPADFFDKVIGDTGSAVSIPVLVTPRKTTSDAPAVSAERPQSESHVLPERKVEAMVEAAGGRMVEIIRTQDDLGGRRTSYYYVTR